MVTREWKAQKCSRSMTNHIRALRGGCVGRPVRLLEFWGPSDSPSLHVRSTAWFTSWCGRNFPISPVLWKLKGEVIDGPVSTMLWVAWKTCECKWMKLAQLIFLILCLGLLWKPWVAVFSSTLEVGMCHLVFFYDLTSLNLFSWSKMKTASIYTAVPNSCDFLTYSCVE